MLKRKLLSGLLAAAMLTGITAPMSNATAAEERNVKEITVAKSTLGNPVTGFDENGNVIYGGDPTVFVDDDTVYLYVGHDYTQSGGGYTMPDYLCYSSKDLKNWEYHGPIMEMTDVLWANDTSAWASQAVKHKGRYYLYYCAEMPKGGFNIGVAVSDSPTGPYQDRGVLVEGISTDTDTYVLEDGTTAKETYKRKASFGHEDIDPTVWIEQDEDGEEHIYLMWGNSNLWMCELEDDMVHVKDQDGNGKIEQGYDKELWYQNINGIEKIPADTTNRNDIVDFTEAPWLYRRKDTNGNAYGSWYVFFAMHWREEMGYATTDDIRSNQWTFGGKLMEPTTGSNTNHPAVFDFKGHTYFVYHNASLPGGTGYRRAICIEEMVFQEDGSIDYIQETSTGLSGLKSTITDSSGKPLAHDTFTNSLNSTAYPITNIPVAAKDGAQEADMTWEIEPGKANRYRDSYVTIEAFNKPGMYMTVNEEKEIVLSHDHNNDQAASSDGKTKDSKRMTFRTLEGFTGEGVTFESVAYPGYYMVSENGTLTLSQNPDASACTFSIDSEELSAEPAPKMVSVSAQKTARNYETGAKLNVDDIRVKVTYDNGETKIITEGYTTDTVDMTAPGTKQLVVSYTENEITKTCPITIIVQKKPAQLQDGNTGSSADHPEDIDPDVPIPEKGSVHTVGSLKYKIIRADSYNTDGSNGTAKVTGMKNRKSNSVAIPSEIELNGYSFKVTEIADKAFYQKSKLKTVVVGDNVRKIGKQAFTGIYKKAVLKLPASRYKALKKLLKSSVGYKKTMKIKKIKKK